MPASSTPTLARFLLPALLTAAWLAAAASASAAAVGAKPRVAVMDFTSPGAPADLAALGSGLQSMITTDLAQVSTLTVVERARLQEVEKELRLSRSKAVDPSTAAKVGKLAGATHLVVGTFQVAGKQMRLDGRLVEVANGKVALAASAEGEKDAFFELEKTLVSKLIAAMDVKVTAKERGEVAKIHTTDFEAFRQYAIGVRLSDDANYQDAIQAMRTALKKDEEFRLARVAITEYERLAAELRARADAITANEVDQHRLKLQGAAAEKRQIIDKLFAIARDPDAKARFRRAAATYMLSCAFGSFATGQLDYWGLEDSFANRRTRESLATRYYADALVLWPKVHLHVHCLSQIGPDRPRALASFDQEFKEISERMRPDLKYLLRTREAASLLRLDVRGEADLADRFYELGMKLDPPIDWQRHMLENRAKMRHALLDFEQSTRLLKRAADLPEGQTHYTDGHSGLLRRYADAIEANGRLAAFFAALPASSPLREYARAMEDPDRSRLDYTTVRAIDTKDLSHFQQHPEALPRNLTARRKLSDGFVLIGNSPVWAVGSSAWTGARSDPRRSDELRYFNRSAKRIRSTFFVFEGSPRRDPGFSIHLDFSKPADFQPSELGGAEPDDPSVRPEVFLVFAARCVDCGRQPDPGTGSWKYEDQPMEAWALALERNRSQLVKLAIHSLHGRKSADDRVEVKATQPVGTGDAARAAVALRVHGSNVTLTAGGKSASFQLPSEVDPGFYGVLARGPGFVSLQALQVAPGSAR